LEQCHTYSLNRNLHYFSWWKLRLQLVIVLSLFVENPFVDGILGHNLLLSRAFFGGNPFVDGILGHNLLLSRAFLVGIPSWMGF
jgi:hypothetical protein